MRELTTMNPIKKWKHGRLFWAWSITGKDVDAELSRAMSVYQRRYQRRPLLLVCHSQLQPAPVRGLQIARHRLIPRRTFYFAVHGGVSVTRSRRAGNGVSGD